MTANSWVPPLPDGWQKTTLRRMGRIFAGGTPDRKNEFYWSGGDVPWLNSGAVNQGVITQPTTFITKQATMNGATRWVAPKSVLIALAGQGKTKGMSARTEIRSTFNQSLAAIEPNGNLDYRYLHYWVQSNYQNIRNLAGGDLRDGLNLDHIGSIEIPLPPRATQRDIADYLDHETAEIDALVSDLSDLLALLAERLPSAVQSHVSRLLLENRTPAQTMTPRGRFNAPAHPFGEQWVSLGYLATVETGSMDTQDSQPDGDFPFFVRSDTVERTHSYTFDQEAILTAGDGAGVGKVFHHFQGKFAAHQRVYVITPQRVHGAFLYWVLRGYFGAIILGGTAKSTVESLRRPMLTGFPVPDLSVQQQEEITQIMDSERNYVEMQIANVRCALSLARERRAALITAAVTGQIDVTARNKPAAEQLEDDIAQGLHREN